MLLSNIALPLLGLAASALAKPSSDFSLKKRQSDPEALVVETLKVQTQKIAEIQGAFETGTHGWSEDDPDPHPGYVSEILNEYHFQVFTALKITAETIGNRSAELKGGSLDVENLSLLFAGQVEAVANDVSPLYVYASASDETFPDGDTGGTFTRFDFFSATNEYMSDSLSEVLKNLVNVAGDQLRQQVSEKTADSLTIFRGFKDDYKTFFDALGAQVDAPSQTTTPPVLVITSQASTSSPVPTTSPSQASTTTSQASTATSQAPVPSGISPGEAPGGCSTDPIGCVKRNVQSDTANILAVGEKIKAACNDNKNNGPQVIYDSVTNFLYDIHDQLLYVDEDIGVYQDQLVSLPIREFGKLGSDLINAVCASLLPLHQLAKHSPKLQGHLKGDLGLLDNGLSNAIKRLVNLDERLMSALRSGLNHARLRTLAGFGDVFVELPAVIGGIKARATHK
ncbi:hypothetical protein JCM5353_005920 [Sporobolomyces roseus]